MRYIIQSFINGSLLLVDDFKILLFIFGTCHKKITKTAIIAGAFRSKASSRVTPKELLALPFLMY